MAAPAVDPSVVAATGAVTTGVVILAVLLFLWYAAGLSVAFAHLGRDRWRGWIPVVGEVELFRLGGVPTWIVALLFVPVVGVYALVMRAIAVHRIGRELGAGGGLTAIGVLLPPVWATLVALRTRGAATTDAPRSDEVLRLGSGLEDTGDTGDTGSAGRTGGRANRTTPRPSRQEARARAQAARAAAAAPAPGGAPAVTRRASAPVPAAGTPVAPVAAAGESRQRHTMAGESGTVPPPVEVLPPAATFELIVEERDRYPLTAARVIVGRSPSGSEPGTQYLPLVDGTRTLSKQHAELFTDGTTWFVQDLASTNGVTIDLARGGVRIPAAKRLAVSGLFRLGQVAVRIREVGAP